jgi:hypothetical protein
MSIILDFNGVQQFAQAKAFKLSQEDKSSTEINFHQAASHCFDLTLFQVNNNLTSAAKILAANKTRNVIVYPLVKHNNIVGIRYAAMDGEQSIEITISAKSKRTLSRRRLSRSRSSSSEMILPTLPTVSLSYAAQVNILQRIEDLIIM